MDDDRSTRNQHCHQELILGAIYVGDGSSINRIKRHLEDEGERDRQKDEEQEHLREVVSCSPTLSLSLKGGCRKGSKTQEIDREGGRREAKQERGKEREGMWFFC